jgi:hypothetical protein
MALGSISQREVGAGGVVVDEAAERRAAVREVRVPPHSAAPFAAPSKSIHMKLGALASRQAQSAPNGRERVTHKNARFDARERRTYSWKKPGGRRES